MSTQTRPGGPAGPGPVGPPRGGPGVIRPMGVGVPMEASRDFRGSARRLASMLREDRLGVVASSTDQCFGHWSGTVRLGDDVLDVDDVEGWAEDVHNRW